MQIARFEAKTSVEGPGERSALWLQGCSLKCPDCCNPELQQFGIGMACSVEEIAGQIMQARAEGLTLLGGEPLDQSVELLQLLQLLRQNNYCGIIMFSGYTWAEIEADAGRKSVAGLCDLVIAGRFERQFSPGGRRWIGSDNQTLHFISDYYAGLREHWPENVREIEIFIRDGVIMVNGSPLDADHEISRMLGGHAILS